SIHRISGAHIAFCLSHIARYAPSSASRYLLPEMRPCINIFYWMETKGIEADRHATDLPQLLINTGYEAR
ncbi:MAG: hypothetical protein K2N88_04635, partial [Muribaculaceae bacterium]|nr:hypothetical protein [Muribaculaceae bacterium]